MHKRYAPLAKMLLGNLYNICLGRSIYKRKCCADLQDEICIFNLISKCQELLVPLNASADEHDGSAANSLWHDMQRRPEHPADGASEVSDGSRGAWCQGSDELFGQSDVQWQQPLPEHKMEHQKLGEAGTLWVDPQDAHAPGALRDGPGLHSKHPDTAQKHHPPTSTNSRKQAAVYGLAAHSSGAFHVGGFLKSVQSGITAVGAAAISWLPPLLRRALSASDSNSVASDHTDEHLGEGYQAVKKEMLVGHLLSLITDGHLPAVPKHLLPALASQLTEAGLLKEWVRWLLVSQPALFNRAFERLFKEEASPAVSVSKVVCSPTRIICLRKNSAD